MQLLPLIALLPLAVAVNLKVSIPNPPTNLPSSTHATLSTLGAAHDAPLRTDNAFVFRNVSAGSYLLEVHCREYAFSGLRVDVAEGEEESVEAWGTWRGNEWANKGEVVGVSKEGRGVKRVWGLEVKIGGKKEYFVEKSGFSPLSVLRSPMILIAIASMGLVFGMPYLMDNMDPELKAEIEERQKGSSNAPAANPLQGFDAAAWLAGSTPKDKATGKQAAIGR